jgi:hypothetical protein
MVDFRISAKVARVSPAGRFKRIDDWAVRRMSETGASTVYEGLPRLSGLKYRPESSKSPLGGRIDLHLRHVEDAEALERVARADRFLSETKIEGEVDESSDHTDTEASQNQPSDPPVDSTSPSV